MTFEIVLRELLRLKWVGNTTRQESPRFPGDCSRVCPPTNSLLQISIAQIHQIFNISYFPQFNPSFKRKSLFPKITQKFTQNRKTLVNVLSGGIWRYMKRELTRDTVRKAMVSKVKTACWCTIALTTRGTLQTFFTVHFVLPIYTFQFLHMF